MVKSERVWICEGKTSLWKLHDYDPLGGNVVDNLRRRFPRLADAELSRHLGVEESGEAQHVILGIAPKNLELVVYDMCGVHDFGKCSRFKKEGYVRLIIGDYLKREMFLEGEKETRVVSPEGALVLVVDESLRKNYGWEDTWGKYLRLIGKRVGVQARLNYLQEIEVPSLDVQNLPLHWDDDDVKEAA